MEAGSNIITASTGREGCDLILEEKPDVAVVDYRFTDISGLEVCKFVRENEEGQGVKLFLFTADESSEEFETAIKVGADTVVLNSPDVGEIVNLVRKERVQKE